METIIKVTPNELDERLIDKIKGFIGGNLNVDVTISLKEFDAEYENSLNNAIEEIESGENLVTFTMDEFMSYTPAKTK